jgi:hypothetical protein
MDQQSFINILLGVAGFCIGWWVNAIWKMVGSMQADISNLHVELAKNYVPRAELEAKLDRILDAVDEIRGELRDKK